MQPYGIKRYPSCCPGHDPHPRESYSNRRSKKARARGKTIAAKRERTEVRDTIRGFMKDPEILSTGIEELDAVLSGEERREMHIFVAEAPKRASSFEQMMGRRPPDKPITP